MTVEAQDAGQLPDWPELNEAQRGRWTAVLNTLVDTLVALVPAGEVSVVIEGRLRRHSRTASRTRSIGSVVRASRRPRVAEI